MLHHKNYSLAEWNMAPTYERGDSSGRVIALDFTTLGEMAATEEQRGTFRPEGEGEVLSSAPLYIGHLPAAFYRVRTEHPESMEEYVTTGQEVLVVVNGVLKLVRD